MYKYLIGLFFTVSVSELCASEPNGLRFENAYLSEVPRNSHTAALYGNLSNLSEVDVELLSVSSDVAKMTMFHQSKEEEGISKMSSSASLIIPANGHILFEPGGHHLMLMGINRIILDQAIENERIELNVIIRSGEVVSLNVQLNR